MMSEERKPIGNIRVHRKHLRENRWDIVGHSIGRLAENVELPQSALTNLAIQLTEMGLRDSHLGTINVGSAREVMFVLWDDQSITVELIEGAQPMQVIYRYPVKLKDVTYVELPREHMILKIGWKPGDNHLSLWAMVDNDPHMPKSRIPLAIIGTVSRTTYVACVTGRWNIATDVATLTVSFAH